MSNDPKVKWVYLYAYMPHIVYVASAVKSYEINLFATVRYDGYFRNYARFRVDLGRDKGPIQSSQNMQHGNAYAQPQAPASHSAGLERARKYS